MAVAYVGQILLGPVAEELSTQILNECSKIQFSRERMERLNQTLSVLIPRIEELDRLEKELNDNRRPALAKLKELLEYGQQLVLEGSDIQFWHYIRKYRYSGRINKLNKDLLQFFQLELPAEILLDGRMIRGQLLEAKKKLDSLSLSVDLMKPTLQECFFDLGSFPEDYWIPSAALIDMWIEVYKLDESDAYVNLLELSSKCLINLDGDARKDAGEIDVNFNELFVIQHHLSRDLAIHKSQETSDLRLRKRLVMDQREDGLPKSWKEYQNQQFKSRIVSIHTGEMEASSWLEMEFPDAEVLILNFEGKNYCLPPFLRKMEKLKVLIITNHGSKHAKLSGFPPVSCLPNLRRVRLRYISIPSLGEIKDPLENLQKLSLCFCEVGEAMKNRTLEYSAIFPNLAEIDIDYCNDLFELPSGICGMCNLQKLSITDCYNLHSLPESIDQIGDMEVLRLHACTSLKEVPDGICRLKKLRFMDISGCLNMEKIPEDFGQLQKLRKLDMRRCSRLSKLPRSSEELKQLEEVICYEKTATLWEPLKPHLSTKLQINVGEEVNTCWDDFFSD